MEFTKTIVGSQNGSLDIEEGSVSRPMAAVWVGTKRSSECQDANGTNERGINNKATGMDDLKIEQLKMMQEIVAIKRRMRAIRKHLKASKVSGSSSFTHSEANSGCGTEELLAQRLARQSLRRELHSKNNSDVGTSLLSDGTHISADSLGSHTNSGAEDGHGGNQGVVDKKPEPKTFIQKFDPPPFSVPICADVTSFDFSSLALLSKFDVIMMDPPWQLASATPTRGVALGYSQLTDSSISSMPVQHLSDNGFIFIWVINARFEVGLNLMKSWGYNYVDQIDWIKQTVNRRLAKSHGYYLQHGKETCIVGYKGALNFEQASAHTDVIFSPRRGQSQKPEQIYHLIEALVPNGKYLEIFARRNNLRDYWVSIGNEL
eukprot:CFRG5950T1